MIDRTQADEIARREVDTAEAPEGMEIVLLEEDTLERPLGWVYFYNSREFLEKGTRRLIGNSPFVVDRQTGEVHYLGTHRPSDVLLEEYEKTRAEDKGGAATSAVDQAVTPPAGGPPPGWHQDPWGQARLRYWDGERWTGHTAP